MQTNTNYIGALSIACVCIVITNLRKEHTNRTLHQIGIAKNYPKLALDTGPYLLMQF